MPAIFVETSFIFGSDLEDFCHEIGEPSGLAYPVRLWGHAMAGRVVDGVLRLDRDRLAEIVSWRGDRDVMWRAMLKHYLRCAGDGKWYLRGWLDHNEAYFNKLEYNRKRDEQAREKRRSSKNLSQVLSQALSQDLSPNLSPSHAHAHAHAHAHDQAHIYTQDQCLKESNVDLAAAEPAQQPSEQPEPAGANAPRAAEAAPSGSLVARGEVGSSKIGIESVRVSRSSEVHEVIDHFRAYHPRALKKPSTKSKEWRHIVDRLEEGYTVDELREAIDGIHETPWNLGSNAQGRMYLSLELAMRDAAHVDRYREQHVTTPAQRQAIRNRIEVDQISIVL